MLLLSTSLSALHLIIFVHVVSCSGCFALHVVSFWYHSLISGLLAIDPIMDLDTLWRFRNARWMLPECYLNNGINTIFTLLSPSAGPHDYLECTSSILLASSPPSPISRAGAIDCYLHPSLHPTSYLLLLLFASLFPCLLFPTITFLLCSHSFQFRSSCRRFTAWHSTVFLHLVLLAWNSYLPSSSKPSSSSRCPTAGANSMNLTLLNSVFCARNFGCLLRQPIPRQSTSFSDAIVVI